MKDLLDKMSSYNLFNYLFPGIVFCVVSETVSGYDLVQPNIVIGIFLYYFVGLVVSRFGSIIIEKILTGLKIVIFAPYSKFIAASKIDPKIEILSESNNMFRTLIAMLICLGLLKLYSFLENATPIFIDFRFPVLGIILLIILVISYKKQTGYITKRIDAAIKTEE